MKKTRPERSAGLRDSRRSHLPMIERVQLGGESYRVAVARRYLYRIACNREPVVRVPDVYPICIPDRPRINVNNDGNLSCGNGSMQIVHPYDARAPRVGSDKVGERRLVSARSVE